MKKVLYFFSIFALAFAMVACEKSEKGDNGGNGGIIDDGGDVIEFDASKFPCLNGSDYYLFVLSASAKAALPQNKIVADYRTDDYNTYLYIWEGTYGAGETSGPNMFGLIEGWPSLYVQAGWSGAGFCCYNKTELDKLPGIANEDYVLHLALKSQDAAVHTFNFYSGKPEESFGVKIGGTPVSAEPTGDYDYAYLRDGEWHEIEIPMSYFINKGLLFDSSKWANATVSDENGKPQNGHNVLAVLSGSFGTLNLDACFVYKK